MVPRRVWGEGRGTSCDVFHLFFRVVTSVGLHCYYQLLTETFVVSLSFFIEVWQVCVAWKEVLHFNFCSGVFIFFCCFGLTEVCVVWKELRLSFWLWCFGMGDVCGVGGSSVFFILFGYFFFFCPLFWSTCMVWKELCLFSVLVLILYAYCVSLQTYVWSERKFSFLVCLCTSVGRIVMEAELWQIPYTYRDMGCD